MDPSPARTTEYVGTGRFLLGHGPEGTCGDVHLRLRHTSRASHDACGFLVEWCVGEHDVPEVAHRQIVSYLESFLEWYLELNPVGVLQVAIIGAGWSMERRNEPERAAALAIHDAIRAAGLPPPPIFG